MATMPEAEEDEQAGKAAPQASPRQQAAVKSIAPAQPAPMARPVTQAPTQTGMFDRIFGWFKKLGNEPAAAEPAPETKPRERSGARPERRERKPPSSRRLDNRSEPREAREQRNERDKETAKPPRPPRQPKPRAEKQLESEVRPVVDVVDSQTPTEAREPRESRNRRGRGGRGRNREDLPQQAAPSEAAAETTAADYAAPRQYGAVVESAQASKAPAPVAVPVAPAQVAQQSLALETRPVNVANTPAAVLASSATGDQGLQQVESQVASAMENNDPSRSDRPRRRRRPSSTLPASETLLQLVETVPVPVVAVSEPASTAPHPTRRRQRPQTPVSNEPLIQVETGNPQ
jgi:ribonuclease E